LVIFSRGYGGFIQPWLRRIPHSENKSIVENNHAAIPLSRDVTKTTKQRLFLHLSSSPTKKMKNSCKSTGSDSWAANELEFCAGPKLAGFTTVRALASLNNVYLMWNVVNRLETTYRGFSSVAPLKENLDISNRMLSCIIDAPYSQSSTMPTMNGTRRNCTDKDLSGMGYKLVLITPEAFLRKGSRKLEMFPEECSHGASL
uniref:Uncharacterized protein n=1 Tax=Ascaris lumbricoides TaxID=6252 RepID=A0A0M3IIJ6_ASCLU